MEVEEPRAWKGFWNENVVKLVELSMRQKDALTVLLTGRSMVGFREVVERIVGSRGLRFDLVVLKPEMVNGVVVKSTLGFKTAFLEEVLDTYGLAEEIRCLCPLFGGGAGANGRQDL